MQLTEAANRLLYKAWSVDKKIFDFGNKSLTADDLKLIAQYLEAAGLARTKGSKEVAEFINRSEKIKEWYKKSDSIMNVEFEEVN